MTGGGILKTDTDIGTAHTASVPHGIGTGITAHIGMHGLTVHGDTTVSMTHGTTAVSTTLGIAEDTGDGTIHGTTTITTTDGTTIITATTITDGTTIITATTITTSLTTRLISEGLIARRMYITDCAHIRKGTVLFQGTPWDQVKTR